MEREVTPLLFYLGVVFSCSLQRDKHFPLFSILLLMLKKCLFKSGSLVIM